MGATTAKRNTAEERTARLRPLRFSMERCSDAFLRHGQLRARHQREYLRRSSSAVVNRRRRVHDFDLLGCVALTPSAGAVAGDGSKYGRRILAELGKGSGGALHAH